MNMRILFLFGCLISMCSMNSEDAKTDAEQDTETVFFTKEQLKNEEKPENIPGKLRVNNPKYNAFKENNIEEFINLIHKERELISPIDESINSGDIDNSKKLLMLKKFQNASIENYRNEHWNSLYIGLAAGITGLVSGALFTFYFMRKLATK